MRAQCLLGVVVVKRDKGSAGIGATSIVVLRFSSLEDETGLAVSIQLCRAVFLAPFWSFFFFFALFCELKRASVCVCVCAIQKIRGYQSTNKIPQTSLMVTMRSEAKPCFFFFFFFFEASAGRKNTEASVGRTGDQSHK